MFLACSRDQLVEATCFDIFFELFVPKRIEMLTKFPSELPSLLRRQLTDRFTNLSHRAHCLILHRQRSAVTGKIDIGMLADIMKIPAPEILKTRCVMTVIGGEIVFQHP